MWKYFECSCKCISIIFTILWCIAALFTAVLVSVSIGVVDLNNIGLKFDTVNFALDNNTIYLPGRYWVGLGTNLINYQTTWIQLSYMNNTKTIISATTSDPSDIYIEATLMYRIRPEFAHYIYLMFPNKNFTWFYNNLAANAIQNVVQSYSINDFLIIRRNISQIMSNKLNLAFRENYAEVMSFQLAEINFDPVYEQFLLKQAITKNEINIYSLNSKLSAINANVNLLNSQTDLIVNNIYSTAVQNSNIIINNAISNGDLNITLSEADSLKMFVSPFGLNFTTQELNKFLLYDKINDLSGFNNPSNNNFTFNFGGINEIYK